jgi:hypothetical protein
MHWLLFLGLIGIHAHDLFLSNQVIENSLRVEEKTFFADEYTCSHGVSGTRSLLRFDFVLGNNGSNTFHTNGPMAIDYAILKNEALLQNGSIEFDCVRDTICSNPTYYTCAPHSLSPQCYARQPWFADCQWIDITDIAERQFEVAFSFEEQQLHVGVDLDTVEHISEKHVLKVIFVVFMMIWLGLATILIPCIYYKKS